MSYLSVSTWSLHRCLGPLHWTVWNESAGSHETVLQPEPQLFTLLELPALAKAKGYSAVEVCHIHISDRSASYLSDLRNAFHDAGLSFDTLLLDYGDLSSGDERRRKADLGLMKQWIDAASLAGARRIRIVAGESPHTDEAAIARSALGLSTLASYAAQRDVKIVTENFKALASTPDSCQKLLQAAGPGVGFITDFGNYERDGKLAAIAATAAGSVSVHVKPDYDEQGFPDEAGLAAMLDAARSSGFDGAYVLIYDGPGDMWEGLSRVQAIVKRHLGL